MRQNKEFTFPAGAEVSIIPVIQGDNIMKIDESELPDVLPILALRNAVLFPGAVFPITIGREKSVRLIREAEKEGFFIGAVPQRDVMVEEPQEEDLNPYGTVCKIIKTLDMPDGTITAILQAFKRLELGAVLGYEPYITARVIYHPDVMRDDERSTDIKALADSLKDKAVQILRSSSIGTRETIGAVKAIDDFRFLVNFIATSIEVEDFNAKVMLLEYDDIRTRGLKLLSILNVQIELMKIKQEINQKVKSEIDQQQREYYLNNQLRTIQEELGMDDAEEFDRFREKAEGKKWPKEVAETFEKELSKLEKYNPSSPDYSVQYNYLEFMLQLPWGEMSRDNLDLKHAEKVLNHDHYGLDKIKERIIEYLAVLKLHQLGTGAANINEEAAIHVRVLHGSHIAKCSLFLAGQHLDGKADHVTEFLGGLVGVVDIAQGSGGKGRNVGDLQVFQRLGKREKHGTSPTDSFLCEGSMLNIVGKACHGFILEQDSKAVFFNGIYGQTHGV